MQILYEILKNVLGFLSGAGLILYSQSRQHKRLIDAKNKSVQVEMECELEQLKSSIIDIARVVTDIAINKKDAPDISLCIPAKRSIILLEKNIEEIYLDAKCNSRKRIKPILLFFSSLEAIRNKIQEDSANFINEKKSYYNGGMDYARLNVKYIRYACGAAVNIRAYIDNKDLGTGDKEHAISFCRELNVNYEELNKLLE